MRRKNGELDIQLFFFVCWERRGEKVSFVAYCILQLVGIERKYLPVASIGVEKEAGIRGMLDINSK